MSPAQVAVANGAEDAQESRGLWSPWCGGQGCAGSRETVLLLCHGCPAHRGHRAPARLTLTQLGLPCTSGSVLTGWTCLADPPCPCTPHHHSTEMRAGTPHQALQDLRPNALHHRTSSLQDQALAAHSLCRAKQPCGSSSGLVAVWLRPPVVAVPGPPAQPAPCRASPSWGCGAGTCAPHPLGRVKRAAGAVRAPCRRQPIMLY